MNAETVLTAVVTGVITGAVSVVGGYFAVLHAMRQFKAQRAFDKQLEWYERTVRALSAVPYLRMTAAFAPHSEIHDDRMKELHKALLDLRQCVDEAALYAEQSSYERLQGMRIQSKGDVESKSDEQEALKAFEEVMKKTLIELSRPVRKMLGLKSLKQ